VRLLPRATEISFVIVQIVFVIDIRFPTNDTTAKPDDRTR
jgi:hypothetical protein